jgi:hypothetical protein
MTPRAKRELSHESFIGYAEKLYTRPVIPGEARGVTLSELNWECCCPSQNP